MKDSKVFDSLDAAHDADDLVALFFQKFQVIAVDLGGQLAFHSTDGLFHVVFDGLREAPDDAGNLVELAIHGGDQFVLVLVKDGPPLFFRLEINEVFGIEEAGCIRAVIRTPRLTGALRDLGKRAKHDSGLVRYPDPLVRSGAGRERATHPECTFIQVGQKFGTDDAAEGEVNRDEKPEHAHTDREHTPANGPSNGGAVLLGQEVHDGVVPFLRSLLEGETGQHGRDQNREEQRPQQRKGDGPGHGMKEPAFDALQGEDRQVSGNDDGDRVEHRPLHFVRGLADSFAWRLDPVLGGPNGARCFRPSPPRRRPPCQNPARRETEGWRECASSPGRWRQTTAKTEWLAATMSAPRTLPRNRNRMIDTRIIPSVRLCSTVWVVK